MNVIFSKCSAAINNSLTTGGYGIFYSKVGVEETLIHVHECCEVLLCLNGGGCFLIDDRIYEVNDGDIFIINQFEPHKITFKDKDNFERYVFQIHPQYIYGNSTDNTDLSVCFYARDNTLGNRISLEFDELKYIKNLIENLKKEQKFGDDIAKNCVINEFLRFLNEKFAQKNLDAQYSENVFNQTNKIISNTVKYINKHYNEAITLADIAAYSFVSVSYLCTLFKKMFGTTIIKYITSKRISEAKKLLNSGKSISEAAEESGFNDYANFMRTFKKVVGVSPKKYSVK